MGRGTRGADSTAPRAAQARPGAFSPSAVPVPDASLPLSARPGAPRALVAAVLPAAVAVAVPGRPRAPLLSDRDRSSLGTRLRAAPAAQSFVMGRAAQGAGAARSCKASFPELLTHRIPFIHKNPVMH